MFSIAFVAVTVRARAAGLDRSLEAAAMDLGATPVTAFFKVTLPLLFPGILAGFLLAFALSMDDFVISQFTQGRATMFPTWVFGFDEGGDPAARVRLRDDHLPHGRDPGHGAGADPTPASLNPAVAGHVKLRRVRESIHKLPRRKGSSTCGNGTGEV